MGHNYLFFNDEIKYDDDRQEELGVLLLISTQNHSDFFHLHRKLKLEFNLKNGFIYIISF